ncbi:MAG: RluA family pseudouridine synthase [bacterium]
MHEQSPAVARQICETPGMRLDHFLAIHWGPLSRRHTRAIIAAGAVRVNGVVARKGLALNSGDVVEVQIAALATASVPVAEAELAITVLYEDAQLIAIDKPAGVPAVALRAADRGTVANFLLGYAAETAAAGGTVFEAGLVHRLDTGTSGVLLAARTRDAWALLREQFRTRQVGKRYVALVDGVVVHAGSISHPIAHDPSRPRRMMVCSDPSRAAAHGARPASTRYRPLAPRSGGTLIEVEIATGVRHQIRVHLAALGHSVLGDALYGRTPAPRLFLHATALTIHHPADGRTLRIESPLPTAFDEA